MSRPIRTLVVALVALAAWLVAGTAMAAAPICDDRGASAFAPPPILDTPNESIDVGAAPEACGFAIDDGVSLHQGRASDPLPAPEGADLIPAGAPITIMAAPEGEIVPIFAVSGSRSGIHAPLERPPR